MAGRLSKLKGTKGIARYNHTDKPIGMGNMSNSGKGTIDKVASPGFEELSASEGGTPMNGSKAPGL